jgi:hypothetical protein
MTNREKTDEEKRQEVDATIAKWTNGLAHGVAKIVTDLKIPSGKNTGLIVASTLIRISCRVVKTQECDMVKFMALVESILESEFSELPKVEAVQEPAVSSLILRV